MATDQVRLHLFLRAALLVQAIGVFVTIALTLPDFIDWRLHPMVCGSCIDLRGLSFILAAIFLGPIVLLLLALSWRWRTPRVWPLAIVALIDAGAIVLAVSVTISNVNSQIELLPPQAFAPPFLFLPALVTLAFGANLVWRASPKPILAGAVVSCLVLTTFVGLYSIRPAHHGIPGDLSLPFSKTAVYEGRDQGCRDYVVGWTDQHRCLRATLLVYHGSGDASRDQTTINRVLLAQGRIRPVDDKVVPLPVDSGVNKTYSRNVDPSNAGLCEIITDRVTPAATKPQLGRCGLVTDYADIRSHWPGADAYAIGIIYYWDRPDFADQPSVTFLNAAAGTRPGETITLRVHASPNTLCSIVVLDPSALSTVQGLDPKATDAFGNVVWTWRVDAGMTAGQWPITVTCGAASGRTFWYAA